MAALQIILTLALVAIMVLAIAKKLNATMTLLALGLIVLVIYVIATGAAPVEETSGNGIIDIFELMKDKFVTTLSGTGLIIMSVMGYVYYMNHIKASKMLAIQAAKPLKKLKSPYIVVVLALVIAALLKLFLPSHSSLTALLMATLYPILRQSGVKKTTAVATIVIGGAFDLGPACPITNWAIGEEAFAALTSVASFFVTYQIPVSICAFVVAVVAFLLISIRADRRVKEEDTDDISEVEDVHGFGIPMWFMIFPMLPLILVLVFSELVVKDIVISVVAANFLSFIVAWICRMIFAGGQPRVNIFNASSNFWDGMGKGFASVVALIGTASVFTTALTAIGGMAIIMTTLASTGAGGALATAVAAVIDFFTGLVTGSGVAAIYVVVPMLPDAAAASGSDLLSMLTPVITAGGLARAVSPISAAIIIAATTAKVDVLTIAKRNAIPAVLGLAVALGASFVIF